MPRASRILAAACLTLLALATACGVPVTVKRESQERVLRELRVHDHLAHERHLFRSTPEAIAHARLHAGRIAHDPAAELTNPPQS